MKNSFLILIFFFFSKIILSQTSVRVGFIYQDHPYQGNYWPVDLHDLSFGNHIEEMNNLVGYLLSSHRMDGQPKYYSSLYDGAYYTQVTQVLLKSHDPQQAGWWPFVRYWYNSGIDYHEETEDGVLVPHYEDYCIKKGRIYSPIPPPGYIFYCDKDLNDNITDLQIHYTNAESARLALLDPSINLGTVIGLYQYQSQFRLKNTGTHPTHTVHGKLSTVHDGYDLDISTTDYDKNFYLDPISPNEVQTTIFRGRAAKFAGPFVHTIIVNCGVYGSKTFYIFGNIKVPDFCFQETEARNTPEEKIFDSVFVSSTSLMSSSVDSSKTIKEKLKFAYALMNLPDSTNEANVCKLLIQKFPQTEMGVAYFALDLLWQHAKKNNHLTDFKKYLKSLKFKKEKYSIYGWAGLILANYVETDEKEELLDFIKTKFKNSRMGEIALFLKFMHFAIDKNDKEYGLQIANELLALYPESDYTYQSQLLMGTQGFTPEGFQANVIKNETRIQNQIKSALEKSNTTNLIEKVMEIPSDFKLFQNYPNPFNPSTEIKFSLPISSNVKLIIFNQLGEVVTELVNGYKDSGVYTYSWDGKSINGNGVASGVYFYQLITPTGVLTNKMVLQK